MTRKYPSSPALAPKQELSVGELAARSGLSVSAIHFYEKQQRIEISPCLWFDNQAEEAANFYVSIFPNSAISHMTRYGKEGHEFHGKADGSVMTAEFSLDGTAFTALNGGPIFKFNTDIS